MMRLKCKYITMSGKCQKHSTPEVNEYCLGSPCEDYEGYGTKEVVPRYIDADALIEDIKHGLWDWETVNGIESRTVLEQTIQDIKNEPTIDAVPVVRCKDCHYAKPYNKIWQLPKRDTLVCTHFANDEVDNNFFCGYAIKKMDEVNDGNDNNET